MRNSETPTGTREADLDRGNDVLHQLIVDVGEDRNCPQPSRGIVRSTNDERIEPPNPSVACDVEGGHDSGRSTIARDTLDTDTG